MTPVIAPPEPGLTEAELVETSHRVAARADRTTGGDRAVDALPADHPRGLLTGRVHWALQPLRYGGYEFGLPAFCRVVTEVARGCPSSGWALSLTAAHVLQVASAFGERAQDEIFGADGEFRTASTLAPVGVAQPDGDHVILDGTWPYSSGAPYSTHYVGQTLRAPEKPGDAPGPLVLFCAPREVWTVLDDWHGVLGLRGSGSNSIRMAQARIPAHHTVGTGLLDLPVEGGSPARSCTATPCMPGGHRASSTANSPPS
ncbi:hypothetical protein SPURM210S_07661 [Streptomyces purpurascens]|nr:hypothetical protein GCM10010303_39410 [Streptomyces purpurascens]